LILQCEILLSRILIGQLRPNIDHR
jgi:hypothetical protein